MEELDEPPEQFSEKLHTCMICDKAFRTSSNLNSHVRHLHKQEIYHPNAKQVKCGLCSFTSVTARQLNRHLESVHELSIDEEKYCFLREADFVKWKEDIEKETASSYVRKGGVKKYGNKQIIYFNCHRSGKFNSRSSGKRNLKMKGSNKIGSFCPSQMKFMKKSDGSIDVCFVKTHVGHNCDLERFPLTKKEKLQIAEKLAQNGSIGAVLDEVRDSISGDSLERVHLLTRRDMLNIQNEFNVKSSVGILHKNDAESVSAWVKNLQQKSDSPIVAFKRHNSISLRYPTLRKEDFLLVLMNSAQCELLRLHGNDVVCIDVSHGNNSYNFELYTLLILDEKREAFPVAFVITNRQDEEALVTAFKSLKELVSVQPRVFMSDGVESVHDAWSRTFGVIETHLLCTWHVDEKWRKALKKYISGQEDKAQTYKILRSLLTETDEVCFSTMLHSALENFLTNKATKNFGTYLQQYYAQHPEMWAYCLRKWMGVNINMQIERMHRTLAYIFLEGKKGKRLDKVLHSLMKFLRDKEIEQFISIDKGEISQKVNSLRQRHKRSLAMSNEDVVPYQDSDNPVTCWDVVSQSLFSEIYVVQKYKDCSDDCPLQCAECQACLHNYICTCTDNVIHCNMCKHIHLVCQQQTSVENVQLFVDDPSNEFQELQENVVVEEIEPGKINKQCYLEKNRQKAKQKIKETFQKLELHLENAKSQDEVNFVNKLCLQMQAQLGADTPVSQENIDILSEEAGKETTNEVPCHYYIISGNSTPVIVLNNS